MDRAVLDLALSEQWAVELKIERLRQQIAAEERRIAELAAFIESYRTFEQRLARPVDAEEHVAPGMQHASSR